MKRILVVDDDPVIRKLLTEILERKGYETILANDGIDAMVAVRSRQPDLVVLDIMMPELNGYDVCRNIKLDPKYREIPIILLTTRDQEIDPRLMGLMGIEYLHKTCKPQDLLSRIEKIIGV